MSDFKQDKEAKEFVKRWADRSSEKEFSQKFWIDLLSNVYGVEQVTEYLEFEKPREMRKHATWYTHGIPGSAELRRQFNQAEKREDFLRILDTMK